MGTIVVVLLGSLGLAWQIASADPQSTKSDVVNTSKDLKVRVAKVEWIAATEAARDAAQKAGQPPRKVRVWIDVHGPLAAGASGYGRLRVEQLLNADRRADAIDWQSPAAKPAAGIQDSLVTIHRGEDDTRDGPWFSEVIKEGIRFYVDVYAGESIRQIGLLRGTLVLRAGGRLETLTIKNIFQHLGKPIDDPSLKAMGITVIPRAGSESPSKGGVVRIGPVQVQDREGATVLPDHDGEEVLIETQWTRSPIMRIDVIDPEDETLPLPTADSSVSNSENTVNRWMKFRFKPPKDSQLKMVVQHDPQLVRVQFTLEEIDLSQGQWIIVPQSAADIPRSSAPSVSIPATPATPATPPSKLPSIRVKSSEVEVLPGTVEVAEAGIAAPPADIRSSEKMKTKEGYRLGHVAGPFFAGCGTSMSSNSKTPAEPVGVTFDFNCPAEGFGEDVEPEPAGPNMRIYILGPLKKEYVRSWAQVQDDLSFNFDFGYLSKEANRTFDLTLLQSVRSVAGLDIQGPMQGDRLVVLGDLGLLAGQQKIRRLWLANCEVSSRMVRNLAAAPNLRILRLFNCKFEGNAMAELATAKSLRCLDLTRCLFDERSLSRLMSSLPELRHLTLTQTPVTDRAFTALSVPPKIQYLNLSGTKVGDRTLEALRQFRNLKVVNLERIPLNAEQIRGLAAVCPLKAISYTPRAGIEKLHEELGQRNIGVFHGTGPTAVEGIFEPDYLDKVFAELPKQFTQVQLMCDLNEIGPQQTDTLNRLRADWIVCHLNVGLTAAPKADALAGLRGVHCINLSGFGPAEHRYDTPEHYAAMFAGWRQSTNLMELEIDDCPIHLAAAANLAEIPSLRALNLVHTGVRDWIGPVLARMRKLERLRLREPEVGDAVIAELAKLKTIRLLDLSETGISDACVDALLGMPALKEVHLFGTGVSTAACDRLRKRGVKVSSGKLRSTQFYGTPDDRWQEKGDLMNVGIR
ncbi:MAG: hypothetical protein ABFC77_09115 [Thermoguttaceae bacterium]